MGKLGFIGILGLFLLLAGCGQQEFQAIPTKIADFKGILINEKVSSKKSKADITSYRSHKGKATLIVLTASWCPACQAEVPLLKELSVGYKDQGLEILMVNEDDSPAVAARYKKKANLPWPMIHWNYDIMNALGNPGVLPVSYLVNEQDSIVKVNVGIFEKKEMQKAVEKLLK